MLGSWRLTAGTACMLLAFSNPITFQLEKKRLRLDVFTWATRGKSQKQRNITQWSIVGLPIEKAIVHKVECKLILLILPLICLEVECFYKTRCITGSKACDPYDSVLYLTKDVKADVKHFTSLTYILTVKSNGYNEGFSTRNNTRGLTCDCLHSNPP